VVLRYITPEGGISNNTPGAGAVVVRFRLTAGTSTEIRTPGAAVERLSETLGISSDTPSP
jgi:hypothetical protein